jgi:PKD repeat protein
MNKKLLLTIISALGLLLVSGCKKDEAAIASFSASKTTADAGETISFTNKSSNAKSYVWDFGDGVTSQEQTPTHQYTTTGSFTVTLTAKGDGGSDNVTQIIKIENPITVIEGEGIKEINVYNTWANAKTAFGSSGFKDNIVGTYDLYVIHQVVNSSKGVAFLILSADSIINDVDLIYCIYLWSPYQANTSKGLSLGDVFSEMTSTYGTYEKMVNNDDGTIFYQYATKGINMWCYSGQIVQMSVYEPYSLSSKKSSGLNNYLRSYFFNKVKI